MNKKSFIPPLLKGNISHKEGAGFTLLEILVALIILAVLASLSMVTFRRTQDVNNDRICQQNLKVLQAAIDVYTLEYDTVPVTLSQLEPRHIHLAYERAAGCDKSHRYSSGGIYAAKAAAVDWLKKLLGIRPAWAFLLKTDGQKYYGSDIKVFHCPADQTPIETTSYQINSAVDTNNNGLERRELDGAGATTAILMDNIPRHPYANGVTKNGCTGGIIGSDTVQGC